MYPVFLNLANRLCVVVGGGTVGWRKLSGLLESGASVRVVCLEPCPPDLSAPRLQWLTEPYQPNHLTGATLAFAAGTPDVNRRVVHDARAQNIWVNAADDPEAADFFVPATLRREKFVLAVGTGGAAPALARRVCALLESQFDDAFGQWVELLGELRPAILAAVTDSERRRDLFERLACWDWLQRLRQEDLGSVRAAMLATIQEVAGISNHPL